MAIASEGRIEYTLLFEDDLTQKLSIGPYDPTYLSFESTQDSIRDNIKNFLSNMDSDTKKLMVSKYGNKWAGFSAVNSYIESRNILF